MRNYPGEIPVDIMPQTRPVRGAELRGTIVRDCSLEREIEDTGGGHSEKPVLAE